MLSGRVRAGSTPACEATEASSVLCSDSDTLGYACSCPSAQRVASKRCLRLQRRILEDHSKPHSQKCETMTQSPRRRGKKRPPRRRRSSKSHWLWTSMRPRLLLEWKTTKRARIDLAARSSERCSCLSEHMADMQGASMCTPHFRASVTWQDKLLSRNRRIRARVTRESVENVRDGGDGVIRGGDGHASRQTCHGRYRVRMGEKQRGFDEGECASPRRFFTSKKPS